MQVCKNRKSGGALLEPKQGPFFRGAVFCVVQKPNAHAIVCCVLCVVCCVLCVVCCMLCVVCVVLCVVCAVGVVLCVLCCVCCLGALLARVQDLVCTGKDGHTFIKLNAGMTDVLRPSLYGAQHPIVVHQDPEGHGSRTTQASKYQVITTASFLCVYVLMCCAA
jgi:hypothetical protein